MIKKLYHRVFNTKILLFHHVSLNPEYKKSSCILETKKFYNLISSLEKIVSLHDIILKSKLGLRKKVAITFDDGLSDVYSIVYPFFKKNRIPFTVFVLSELLDTPGYLTSEQLKEMSKSEYVTIGIHGTFHKILTSCSNYEKYEEISKSKEKIEKIINASIDIFAYSHGQYNKTIINLLKENGYKFAFTTKRRPCDFFGIRRKYELPRYNVDELSYEFVNQCLNIKTGNNIDS